jgi:hypothetical protein
MLFLSHKSPNAGGQRALGTCTDATSKAAVNVMEEVAAGRVH